MVSDPHRYPGRAFQTKGTLSTYVLEYKVFCLIEEQQRTQCGWRGGSKGRNRNLQRKVREGGAVHAGSGRPLWWLWLLLWMRWEATGGGMWSGLCFNNITVAIKLRIDGRRVKVNKGDQLGGNCHNEMQQMMVEWTRLVADRMVKGYQILYIFWGEDNKTCWWIACGVWKIERSQNFWPEKLNRGSY